jgi:hypothetical protein
MYRNPEEIADELLDRSRRIAEAERERLERERRKKARRIRRLTRQAMREEGKR